MDTPQKKIPVKLCFVQLRAYAVFRPELKEKFGGAEVQTYLLARELAKDPDFDVTCVARDFGQADGERIEAVLHRKIPQGGSWARKIKPLKYFASALGLYRTLEDVDADVYIQRTAGVETGIVARFCARHGKTPVVSVACDRHVKKQFEDESPWWVWRPFAYGVRRASLVICQNEFQKRTLRERYGKEAQVVPSLCDGAGAYSAPDGENVLWVSRCVRQKRPEVFLELARAFPGRKFVMVLNEGKDAALFSKTMEDGKTIPNLEIVESVPFQEIDRYFREAKVFVNTATIEGFPNTFLHAMNRGVPILSLSVDPDGLLTKEKAGLFAENDTARLRENLRTLLKDGETYEETSRRSYDYVFRRHDLRSVVEEYKAIFRDIGK